ncbi:cyclin-I-like isoform X2 [Ornithodoros turicata]|uniref:cyclin-I-like isoform X2 n=1 Tax=Ornithodoros turicata TaxID=34597 RepID=UPI00313A27FF
MTSLRYQRRRPSGGGAVAMVMQKGLTADEAVTLVQQYLRKEQQHWRPCKYSAQGDEILSAQRNQAVKWLTVMNRCLKFNPETLFLAVTLLDDFLRLVRARPKYLKCIAISCFYLASKIVEEDDMVPHIKDLITDSNCNFSVSEIMRMEAIILKKLNWNLCRTTALDFLHGFHALLVLNRSLLLPDQSAAQLEALGPLMETKLHICLCQPELLTSRPSVVALALVSLELETWTRNWFVITVALQRLAQVENADVIRCREDLARTFTVLRPVASRKHRHSESNHTPKPSKRKMENMDIEEIYDSIKKLYGDEGAGCSGMHLESDFPIRAM